MFFAIPLALWATFFASGAGLAWYHSLSQEEKDAANSRVLAVIGNSIEWWNSLSVADRERITAIIISIVQELFGKTLQDTADSSTLTDEEWAKVGTTIRERQLI